MSLEIGLKAEIHLTVTEAHSAETLGSGDLPVFSTPSLLALMEAAAVRAIAPVLAQGQSSVGVSAEIKHLAATPLGLEVRARAEVTAVDGRSVTFRVEAWDSAGLIGEGVHGRVLIDKEKFMARVMQKKTP